MRIIEPYVEVDEFNPYAMLLMIEYKGRVCYKSEDRITDDSADRFVASLIKRGHESVLEHGTLGVKFVVDRGVSHEIVRHRLAAYSQESTRYCNYGNDDQGITVVSPFFFKSQTGLITFGYNTWLEAMINSEVAYLSLISMGCSPQEARSVLPNSLKTEIEVTYNLREWRHFFHLRCARSAHPQMRQATIPLLLYLQEKLLVIFDDIPYDEDFPVEHYAKVRERNVCCIGE